MDKSWMGLERGDPRYIQGIVEFVHFAKQNGEKTHLYPCRRCLLVRGRIASKEMFVHLIIYGFMNGYNTWTSHGDKSNELLAYTLRQQWLAKRHGESSSGATHHQTNPTIELIEDQFPIRHLHQEDDNMNMNPLDGDLGSRMAYESYNNLISEAQTPLYRNMRNMFLKPF
ncbi:unnamed protein product [Rhodiola kirilowii]